MSDVHLLLFLLLLLLLFASIHTIYFFFLSVCMCWWVTTVFWTQIFFALFVSNIINNQDRKIMDWDSSNNLNATEPNPKWSIERDRDVGHLSFFLLECDIIMHTHTHPNREQNWQSFLADCEHPWKDINRNESDDHDPLFHCCPPLCFSFSHDLTKCNFVELKRNTSSSKLLPMFHNDYCLEYNRNSFPRFDHSVFFWFVPFIHFLIGRQRSMCESHQVDCMSFCV